MKSKTFVQRIAPIGYGLLLLGLIAAPFMGAYPVFVMKLMCFALFASAFNLLLGYTARACAGWPQRLRQLPRCRAGAAP